MINIIKSNGQQEVFSEEKVLNSIKRAGIPKNLQADVLKHVNGKLFEGITTSEIHNHIKEFLKKSSNPQLVVKYDLKRAIMALGPTGYPFEDYVSKLLQHQQYKTKARTIVKGKCISHEIDVIGEKENKTVMVEAKFHNEIGNRTDIHVALYTYARFLDTKDQNHFDRIMLITNTQATTDAISYAACMGMEVISWNYPQGESLRDWVEKMALYPITALTALTAFQKAQLLQQDVVLCQDLCKRESILDIFELSKEQKEEILQEANFACGR